MRVAKVLCWVAIAFSPMCVEPSIAQHMNAKDSPCLNAGSDFQVGLCLDRARKKVDGELNRFYGVVLSKLEAPNQEKLRAAQRLWVQYRDQECEAESGLYEGGSAMPIVFSACLESETRHRLKDLHDGYDWVMDK